MVSSIFLNTICLLFIGLHSAFKVNGSIGVLFALSDGTGDAEGHRDKEIINSTLTNHTGGASGQSLGQNHSVAQSPDTNSGSGTGTGTKSGVKPESESTDTYKNGASMSSISDSSTTNKPKPTLVTEAQAVPTSTTHSSDEERQTAKVTVTFGTPPPRVIPKFDYDDPNPLYTSHLPNENWDSGMDTNAAADQNDQVNTETNWRSNRSIALYAGCSIAVIFAVLLVIYMVTKTCFIWSGHPEMMKCCLCDTICYGVTTAFLLIWNYFKDCCAWLCFLYPSTASRRGYKGMVASESTPDLIEQPYDLV